MGRPYRTSSGWLLNVTCLLFFEWLALGMNVCLGAAEAFPLFHPYGVELTFVGLVMKISSLRDLINTRWIFAKLISSNGIRKIKNDKRNHLFALCIFCSVVFVFKRDARNAS
jgi:hypothetical protein